MLVRKPTQYSEEFARLTGQQGAVEDPDVEERQRAALADALAEGEQLKATIRALRDELEAREHDHQRALQGERRAAADERRQLEEAIGELRSQLEASQADRAAAEQEAKRLGREEMGQLESTIRELRSRLESSNGH